MTRTILVLAVIASFVLGSIATGTITYADHNKGEPYTHIVESLDALTLAIQGIDPTVTVEPAPVEILESDDLPIEFVMLATLHGIVNPQGTDFGILFYGETLCRLEGSTSYLIQFGMQTTVEHQSNSCPGNGELFLLEGGTDAVFEKGDILVVTSDNGFFTEVYREQT